MRVAGGRTETSRRGAGPGDSTKKRAGTDSLGEGGVSFQSNHDRGEVIIEARVKTVGRTGVEMEALTAVSVAALTIYDMCKAADRGMILTDIRLITKRGGKSGIFNKEE